MSRPSAIHRALALARSGGGSIAWIRQRLQAEGYQDDQINSPVVLRLLRRVLIDARRAQWKRTLALQANIEPGSERTGGPDALH